MNKVLSAISDLKNVFSNQPDTSDTDISQRSYDMVVFCHLRWEFVYQRPQHIISRMSEFYKILFVEEPIGFEPDQEFTAQTINVNKNLTVIQPRVRSITDIGKALEAYITKQPVPIAWFYSASFYPVLQNIGFKTIVYDCMDELSMFKGASPELVIQESHLLKKANIVFTGGKSLYEAKKELHPHVHCFPSSVERQHFEKASGDIAIPKDIAMLQKPIVGYYGVIDERIDYDLLQNIALQNPNHSFVMIGPLAKVSMDDLPKQPNIHYLGMKHYQDLPAYLKAFDVAMMPFAINESTMFISPTKTLEYMAASKHIISTPINDVVKDYSAVLNIVKNAQEFTSALQNIERESGTYQQLYKEILDRTSWDKTVHRMKELLENINVRDKKDIVIIGAGISGCVLAERFASIGKKVLIIEKRDHIAGNCYDYKDENQILVSKYGAHLFHTNEEEVWTYLNGFAKWYPWEHKVLAHVDGQLVPIPVNTTTVNKLFGLNMSSEEEMETWLDNNRVPFENPQNGREAALSRVGPVLYEKMFNQYTKKQWGKYPEELDASVLNRIPIRSGTDDRYFSDKYQALPQGGYTELFRNILDHANIEVRLNTDYFDIKDQITGYENLFYTGPIDRFFDFKHGLEEQLEYRSINFVFETVDRPYFQENSVVNYPGTDVAYTRIIEYKHFGDQKSEKTTIVKEYTTDEGDPYYPVPNPRNQQIYEKYKAEAEQLKNVYFVGRLANYKYFNMDQAFKNALDLFDTLQKEAVLAPEMMEHA